MTKPTSNILTFCWLKRSQNFPMSIFPFSKWSSKLGLSKLFSFWIRQSVAPSHFLFFTNWSLCRKRSSPYSSPSLCFTNEEPEVQGGEITCIDHHGSLPILTAENVVHNCVTLHSHWKFKEIHKWSFFEPSILSSPLCIQIAFYIMWVILGTKI